MALPASPISLDSLPSDSEHAASVSAGPSLAPHSARERRQPRAKLTIAILVHADDVFEDSSYILRDVAQAWRDQGHHVHIIRGTPTLQQLPCSPRHIDCAVQHVDLTVVPQQYRDFASQFGCVINGGVHDISKRVVSCNRVVRGDGYRGPVIVKTNRNCGGQREAQHIAERGGILRRWMRSVHRRLHWSLRAELGGKQYPVFDSPEQVPWPVWHNPWLIVERFMPEQHDGQYWLRSWLFLGDQGTLSLRSGDRPIVALPHVRSRRFVPCDIPPHVAQRRRELGFDFGKFDYGHVGNDAPTNLHSIGQTAKDHLTARGVLYDANRTPTNRSMTQEERAWQGGVLAAGVWGVLDSRTMHA